MNMTHETCAKLRQTATLKSLPVEMLRTWRVLILIMKTTMEQIRKKQMMSAMTPLVVVTKSDDNVKCSSPC